MPSPTSPPPVLAIDLSLGSMLLAPLDAFLYFSFRALEPLPLLKALPGRQYALNYFARIDVLEGVVVELVEQTVFFGLSVGVEGRRHEGGGAVVHGCERMQSRILGGQIAKVGHGRRNGSIECDGRDVLVTSGNQSVGKFNRSVHTLHCRIHSPRSNMFMIG